MSSITFTANRYTGNHYIYKYIYLFQILYNFLLKYILSFCIFKFD